MKTTRKSYWIVGIVICGVLFLTATVVFRVFKIEGLPFQFLGALIGVVITAIITVLLLKGQTANAETLEKNVKVFERKQEVYHDFIAKVRAVVQDGEITINHEQDELKELIFQLSYLQMHASDDTLNNVLDKLSVLIQAMNDYYSLDDTEKQRRIANFYARFARTLSEIVVILKKDLYGEESRPLTESKMNAILQDCGLFVETQDFDKYGVQHFFWDTLQQLFKERGRDFEIKDFTQDIDQYYARVRNRHRGYGIDFPVYRTKDGREVVFFVKVDDSYYYGFNYADAPYKDAALTRVVGSCSPSFSSHSDYHAGWKNSDRYPLNFWKMDLNGFRVLNDPGQRDNYMLGIVDEMEGYIRQFVEKAKAAGL